MSVGIDIGTKSIKVVEIVKESGKPVLKAAGIVGVKDASVNALQTDQEYMDMAQIIKKLVASAKISKKEVSVSIPESLAFTRSLRFPMLNDSEIASAVKWQAEDIIPIPIREAIVQHTVLERNENAQPPEVVVLVVAAPRTLVEKYVKLLTLAGLTVVGVETELLAMTRSLSPAGQTVLILNLGSKSTDIAIARNAKLLFTRTIPTGGDAFTRAVAQVMSVSVDQAEQYKRTYGLTLGQLEGKVAGAILPIFRIVTEEVKKAVHYYQTEEKGEAPKVVILSGGGAGLPDMSVNLAKTLNSEVIIANPFSKVSVDPNLARNIIPYAPLYSVCVGLALREE